MIGHPSGVRVLVVDPDPAERGRVRAALTQSGCAASIAERASVGEAVAALAAGGFDAVLVTEPLGSALASERRRAGDAVAILLVAATADAAVIAAALAAGITDVLDVSDRAPHRLALRVALAVRAARTDAQTARATAGRDQILSIVSHDLRGPLHAIGLACEALRDDVPEGSRRFLGSIERAADRAERLINDLLEANVIESGRLELARAAVDAAAIVRQAAVNHADLVKIGGSVITTSLPGVAIPVYVDRDRVMQVLGNLIQNALKHAKGTPIAIAVAADAGVARISVRDGGPGVSAEELSHLFDRHWAGHKRKGGLGLTIARGMVAAHGGELIAASTGAGLEMSFTLPLVSSPR